VIQLGIFAKTFAGTSPDVVLAAAREAGFATVQYNMACSGVGALPDVISDEVVSDIVAAVALHDVSLAAVSATYNMIHPDVTVRIAGRRSFAEMARVAKHLGTSVLTVCTGSRHADDQWRHHPDNQSQEAWTDLLEEFRYLLDIAESYNVTLGVEPEMANVVNSAIRAKMLIDSLKSDRVGIVLDPANLSENNDLNGTNKAVSEAIDLLGDHVVLAHAKDRNAAGAVVAAGRGTIDFRHLVVKLRSAGFAGSLITHGLLAVDASHAAKHLQSILDETA
jgi:sugar phosphate isomerase/epimerase